MVQAILLRTLNLILTKVTVIFIQDYVQPNLRRSRGIFFKNVCK